MRRKRRGQAATQAPQAVQVVWVHTSTHAPQCRQPLDRVISLSLIHIWLVAGTGNRSEAYVGYFTKWGDGAHDFNPISDLTVTEVYEFLRYLNAPECVIAKVPSAALFDGQTDESEMGVTYSELDAYIGGQTISREKQQRIDYLHAIITHKRAGIARYGE